MNKIEAIKMFLKICGGGITVVESKGAVERIVDGVGETETWTETQIAILVYTACAVRDGKVTIDRQYNLRLSKLVDFTDHNDKVVIMGNSCFSR